MAKKRKSYRRHYRRVRRYIGKQKMPLEVGVTLLGTIVTPAKTGWNSPLACMQNQDYTGVGNNIMSGFTGITPGVQPDVGKILNPFDMEFARYTKMLIIAGLVSKVRKRLVKVSFGKIPFIGGMIS